MQYMNCCRMLRGPRRVCRCCVGLILALPLAILIAPLICPTVIKRIVIPDLCNLYRQNQSSGAVCEELCGEPSSFTNYDCIAADPRAFTAERSGNVYEFHFVEPSNERLSWRDNNGKDVYPNSGDLYHMIKMHLLLNYNVSLEESALKTLIDKEIDENQPTQIVQLWELFNDNNYLMAKLYEDEAILPTVLGHCGSIYIAEKLNIIFRRKRVAHKILHFKALYEYVVHLDKLKPDPIKLCLIELEDFGLTADSKVKAVHANHMKLESQLHKELASGKPCTADADCRWHDCEGICDRGVCNDAPRHDNVQMLCNFVQRFPDIFKYLLVEPRMRQFFELKCKQKFAHAAH